MATVIFFITMFPTGNAFAASKILYVDFGQQYSMGSVVFKGTGNIKSLKFHDGNGTLISNWPVSGTQALPMGNLFNVKSGSALSYNIRYIAVEVQKDTDFLSSIVTYSEINGVGTSTDRKFSVTEYNPVSTDPPEAPTGLIAVAGIKKVMLTWDVTNRATSYNVYIDGVKVNTSALTSRSYELINLTAGKTYTFSVTAVNGYGESPKTSVTSIPEEEPPPPLPPDTTPPSVPVLQGKPGNAQAVLTWTKSSDSDLAGYKLYQDGKRVGTYTTNSAEITGLKNGKEYIFQVSAVDLSNNESAKSNKVSITPIDKLNVNLVPNGDSIVVQMSNGTAPYKIDWGLAIKTVDQTQYQIEGLQFKTDYTVTVTDANGLVYTQTINTGDTKGYVPPTFPNPQELFQKMLNAFGTAGTISVAIIGGAIALGIFCVLAMWAFRLLKRWLSQAK